MPENAVSRAMLAGLLATLVFAAISAWAKFPFMADDFIFLRNAADPGNPYTLGDLGKFITRAPVYSVVTYAVFKTRIWEHTWALLYVFFFVHAFSLALIVEWFWRELGAGGSRVSRVGLAVLVALLPSNHEVLYWPLCMPYVLGSTFVALGLWARAPFVRGLWFLASFAVLETFVLATLALVLAPAVLLSARAAGPLETVTRTVRASWPVIATWAAALAVFFALRKLLAPVYGAWVYELTLEPSHFLRQSTQIFEMLFVTHFYRINWVSTFLELGAVALALRWLARGRDGEPVVRPRQAAWMPILLFASVANLVILSYYAPRAFYGGYLLRQALVAWILLLLWQTGPARLRRSVIGAIAVAYLAHSFVIFANKNKNARQMSERETRWIEQMKTCEAPCVIEAGNPAAGLKYDWILPEMFWDVYFEWLIHRHAPGKAIQFKTSRE
ncbi:MAG TPA: hypothetical protein VFV50_13570 [Bdellovibrionales bacterium]|nr:hypothetical protein [Bdellovibrionales bacterium]